MCLWDKRGAKYLYTYLKRMQLALSFILSGEHLFTGSGFSGNMLDCVSWCGFSFNARGVCVGEMCCFMVICGFITGCSCLEDFLEPLPLIPFYLKERYLPNIVNKMDFF